MPVKFAVVWSLAVVLVGCRAPSADDTQPPPPPAEPQPPADASAKSQPTTQVHGEAETKFWTWFVENEARLRQAIAKDAVEVVHRDPMNDRLKEVNASLIFELSRKGGDIELVITADGRQDAFPAVEALTAAAPEVDGWHVTAFRPRYPDLDALEFQFGSITASPTAFLYRSRDEGALLGLTVYIPGAASDNAKRAGFVLLDHVLGEQDTATQIGSIEWATVPANTKGLKPLKSLRAEVDARKAAP